MMQIRMLPALVLVMVATACSVAPRDKADPAALSAVVRYLQLEGGCWVLETPGGKVQPLDLPAELRRDGQRVVVVLADAPDVMTTCQAGPVKRIVSIKAE
jgi:hypothetical protein